MKFGTRIINKKEYKSEIALKSLSLEFRAIPSSKNNALGPIWVEI